MSKQARVDLAASVLGVSSATLAVALDVPEVHPKKVDETWHNKRPCDLVVKSARLEESIASLTHALRVIQNSLRAGTQRVTALMEEDEFDADGMPYDGDLYRTCADHDELQHWDEFIEQALSVERYVCGAQRESNDLGDIDKFLKWELDRMQDSDPGHEP